MKEHKALPNRMTKSCSLAALMAAVALGISASGAYAQLIVTPDQFQFQTWGGNIQYGTVGAYGGDNPVGGGLYGYTLNYGASPSATIQIPLGNSLAPGWNAYDVYMWIPQAQSQYWVVNVAANGTLNTSQDGEPWAGQFGTQVQYQQVNGSVAGNWSLLGPGPQNDPSLNGAVWINGSDNPYLQIHYLGFENSLQTFDAIMVVAVPEPSTLALGLLGGFALLGGIARRNKH